MTGGDADYSPRYDDYTSEEYPPDWRARRRKVLRRDDYVCQGCGLCSTRVDDVRFDVDHVVPKSDGGSHALDNLQTLCPRCHAEKHPGNESLARRAREFDRRNRAPLVVRVLRAAVRPLLAPLGLAGDDDTVLDDGGRRLEVHSLDTAAAMPTGEGVTVEVVVDDRWESDSDSVGQLGTVRDADGAGTARFVVWSGHGHPRLRAGRRYRFVGAETGRYDGEFQVVVDGRTAVQPLD